MEQATDDVSAGPQGHSRSSIPPKVTFDFVDVFGGIGGMTLGFMDESNDSIAVFAPRLVVDSDREARGVFVRNHPRIRYLCADVHELSGSEIRARAGMAPDDTLHVLLGGPPCQGFSGLGRRALEDKRNVHVVDFLRLVRELKPLVAIMENVPQVITSHEGAVIREVCESFSKLGYASCADVLWASDYGVPQLRKRAFVMAYHSRLGLVPQFPTRTHERVPVAKDLIRSGVKPRLDVSKQPYISVEEAIGDLPSIAAGGGEEVAFYATEPQNSYQRWCRQGAVAIFNHKSRAHTADYLEKISVIQEGSRNDELPKKERFSDNYYSQAYARLHRHGIAQTVTTYFGNPGSGRFMHYRDLRSITVREAARLQTFPDSFVFAGPSASQMRHVGNAVPLLLARALRDQVSADLNTALRRIAAQRDPTVQANESPEERSRIMRAVPSKHSSAERLLRKHIRAADIEGYRLHAKNVPGTPDLVFPEQRIAIFVDGCFWHGCARCYREPHSHKQYWQMKVRRNRDRDARVNAECKKAGWRVLRFWEHQMKGAGASIVNRIRRALKSSTRKTSRSTSSRKT